MAQDKYHGKWDSFPFKSFDVLKYESVSSIAHHIKALKWFKKQVVIWENPFFLFLSVPIPIHEYHFHVCILKLVLEQSPHNSLGTPSLSTRSGPLFIQKCGTDLPTSWKDIFHYFGPYWRDSSLLQISCSTISQSCCPSEWSELT